MFNSLKKFPITAVITPIGQDGVRLPSQMVTELYWTKWGQQRAFVQAARAVTEVFSEQGWTLTKATVNDDKDTVNMSMTKEEHLGEGTPS